VKIYDVTRALHADTWVWPGDRQFSSGSTWRRSDGATVNVAHFTMSCQAGTHIDAPFHFSDSGPKSEEIPLAACVGPCVVISLAELDRAQGERLLIKADGAAPTAEQVRRPNLKLFGTDHVSVDPMDSKTLEAHHALWSVGAVILEGLDLSDVPDGNYQLCALPLKVVGLDGAPVRAILLAP
jgi:arylformamidase